MAGSRPVFHTLSYLQYPAVGIAGLFVIRALLSEREGMLDEMNTALVFIGLSVSLSTLQDTTTRPNETCVSFPSVAPTTPSRPNPMKSTVAPPSAVRKARPSVGFVQTRREISFCVVVVSWSVERLTESPMKTR
ncbi:MAG: hypothetical protein AAFP86_09805, partial [Planctomycetota bacterium]